MRQSHEIIRLSDKLNRAADGDDEDVTSWVTVETQGGYELKRFSYGSGYTDVEIWVD